MGFWEDSERRRREEQAKRRREEQAKRRREEEDKRREEWQKRQREDHEKRLKRLAEDKKKRLKQIEKKKKQAQQRARAAERKLKKAERKKAAAAVIDESVSSLLEGQGLVDTSQFTPEEHFKALTENLSDPKTPTLSRAGLFGASHSGGQNIEKLRKAPVTLKDPSEIQIQSGPGTYQTGAGANNFAKPNIPRTGVSKLKRGY